MNLQTKPKPLASALNAKTSLMLTQKFSSKMERKTAMVKTATIKITLLKQANDIPNEQLEQEIMSHLNQYLNGLPWQETAKSVKITESAAKKSDVTVGVLDLQKVKA